jgi:tetratricopeptide (TPR) repeat protein
MLGTVYRAEASLAISPLSLDEGFELARQTINKALDVDPQYGPAYAQLASIELDYGWDFTAAEQHVKQALALDPGDADILRGAAGMNRMLGRLDEAIDLQRQALALDPLSTLAHLNLAFDYARAGRLDEAVDSAQMLLSLNPGGVFGHWALGIVLLVQGDAPAALAEMEREAHGTIRLHGTAIIQHALGNAGASDAALEELIECCAGGDGRASADYQIAQVYAYRGEIDHAFEWLEAAYDNRDGALPGMRNSILFSNLHDDPRWEPFLDKMGLPH